MRGFLGVLLQVGWGLGWLGAWAASAAPYEVEQGFDGEQELFALLEDGTLSAESWAALVSLRRAGVEVERASRGVLYALPGLTYSEVDARLRTASSRGGVLTEEETRRLAPFLVKRGPEGVSGDARWMTAFSASDSLMPPMALQLRAGGLAGLRVGLLATWARRRLGALHREPRSRALLVGTPGTALLVPKFHGQWMGTNAHVLVGTYRLGFGQRLTLDTTSLPAPDGFLPDDGVRPVGELERECLLVEAGCDAATRGAEVTPDFRWDEGFRGVAGTVRGALGEDWLLTVTGFGSYQSRSLQRSEVMDVLSCPPASVEKGTCEALEVLVPVASARREKLRARTLPGVFREWAGGGNATLEVSPRARVGVTGWGASPVWPDAVGRLDFRLGSRYPAGGAFGAVGVDAAWGVGPVDLFVEGSRGFDSAPGGGGGWAALQRTVVSGTGRELEVSLRYRGRGFINPYGGAPSEPEGLGVRLRYLHRWAETWRFRGQVDGAGGLRRLRASARVDWRASSWLQPSLQLGARESGVGQEVACAGADAEHDAMDSCSSGSRYEVVTQVRSVLSESVEVTARYGGARVVERGQSAARWDGRALVGVMLRAGDAARLGARVEWKDEDLSEHTRLRRELRTTVDVGWSVLAALTLRGRYAWVLDLKARETPRHLVQVDVETRF
ncbi:hypothetical protein [Myxococcus landrumensis]|uniref:hypothetical protein n=1 Tax=Myxococcus landrumensis TaxID=2813577 RepID=UPI001F50E676|nr:hypothetical protein [Myxococcus landrumus]